MLQSQVSNTCRRISPRLSSQLVRFSILFVLFAGAGIFGRSQTPSVKSPQDVSATASPQTDLSGTYVGQLRYPEKGFYGEAATLVITGDRFTLTIGPNTLTGRITSRREGGQFRVEIVFDSEPPSSTSSPISVTGIRKGEDIWLGGTGGRVYFYFGTGRLLDELGTGGVAGSAGPDAPGEGPPRRSSALRARRVPQVGSTSSARPEDSTAGSQPPVGSSPVATPDTSIFSNLKGDANVVFTTPDSMKMDETKVIELLVSPSKSTEELTAKLSEPGRAGTGTTEYADRMEAQLTSTGFHIEAMGPAIQPVAPGRITKWMWQIKPKNGGPQRLDLTLSAVLGDGKAMVRTFNRDININVSWTQKASGFIGPLKDLQWLWAAIIVPIVGAIYAWWRKRGSKRSKKEEAEN